VQLHDMIMMRVERMRLPNRAPRSRACARPALIESAVTVWWNWEILSKNSSNGLCDILEVSILKFGMISLIPRSTNLATQPRALAHCGPAPSVSVLPSREDHDHTATFAPDREAQQA
jgi:hypothetical protein